MAKQIKQENISLPERNKLLIESVLKKYPEKPQKPARKVLGKRARNYTPKSK